MTPFQYTPLDIARQEIRLLILQPRFGGQTIQAHLQPCSLSDDLEFEALSYTWGNPLPRQHIEMGSHSWTVGPSLHVALSHLRHDTAPRTLWIDALCINQEDVREREEQVEQMRLIYQRATRVLVWLGEKSEDSDAAMDLIMGIENIDLRRLQADNDSELPAEWKAVFTLLERQWWNRVWIIQEVAVGKMDPLVGCGDRWIPWSKFETLDEVFGDVEEAGAKFVQGVENPISRLRNIRGGMQGRRKSNWRDLFLLLRATHGCQATDARDKVFALLGLSSDSEQAAIRPNYSSSVVEVYTAVARYLIESRKTLDCLIYFKPSELPGLPSWVPDFNISDAYRTHLGQAPLSKFSADNKPIVEFLGDSKIKVRGWDVDTVREVSPELYDSEAPSDSISHFEQLARKTLPENPTSAQVDSLIERFWRCLLADRTMWLESPIPDSYAQLYAVFCGRESVPGDFQPEVTVTMARLDSYLWPLTARMLSTLPMARFFITRNGRLGIGPLEIQKGDSVVIFQGADVPFILRKLQDDGSYHLLREAYVSGISSGELLEEPQGLKLMHDYKEFVIS